jgi:subtilisin family serine protease
MKHTNKLLVVFFIFFSINSFSQVNKQSLSRPHESGELLIKIRESSLKSASFLSQEFELLGSIKSKALNTEGLSLHKFSENEDLIELSAKITEFEDVEYVELNHHHYLQATPNDPSLSNQYGLSNESQPSADISAKSAWSVTTGSRRVLVGIIDTGIDYMHPDINPNTWVNPGEYGKDSRGRDKRSNGVDDDGNGYVDDYKGWDFYSNDNDPMDSQGHGTHVAGIIGAKGNNGKGVAGVNWSVSLVGLKVFSNNGRQTRTDALVSAINYANRMGISITNNSWGGGPYSESIRDAIKSAGSRGHLFVAAAGNDGSNNDSRPFYPANYGLSNMISVGATDSRDRLASFSNYSPNSVDIAAPGANIYSTLPRGRYGYLSGTSMAAPYVTGVAALIKARSSSRSASSIKSKILNGADSVRNLSGRIKNSRRLNAYRAVK